MAFESPIRYIVCDFVYPSSTLGSVPEFTLELMVSTTDTTPGKFFGFSAEVFVIVPGGHYADYPVNTGNLYTATHSVLSLSSVAETDIPLEIENIIPVKKAEASQANCSAVTCGGLRGSIYIHRLSSNDVANDSQQPVQVSHVRFYEENP